MFEKILIANRGEIACRVMRTASAMGVRTVAVYSDQDVGSMHVEMADEAYRVGEAPANQSYLDKGSILEAARRSGAQALHPGYGFLSENAPFAQACGDAGVVFVGPPPSAIEAMGAKDVAKRIMSDAGVPTTPGYHGQDQDDQVLVGEARAIGYPLLVKAVMGGGGKGMRLVERESELIESLAVCRRESQAAFGDESMILEKFINAPRHVEVQVFADSLGNAVHLFERDCSVQRRHQKVLEEAPAPHLTEDKRQELGAAAVRAALAVGYQGAGTVEFLLDTATEQFFFCEMNTRLQVEHPVTEMVTGMDLVEWQLRIAAGEPLPVTDQSQLHLKGHAVEARIYAENPSRGFLPATGVLTRLRAPEMLGGDVRVDTGVREGDEVSVHYDPLIAKLIAFGPDREQALRRLVKALRQLEVLGVPTNVEFCERCAAHAAFREGGVTTRFLEDHADEVAIPSFTSQPPHAVALIALAVLLTRRQHALDRIPTGPWSPAEGAWRMAGERNVLLKMEDDAGEEVPAKVTCRADGSYKVKTRCAKAQGVEVELGAGATLTKCGKLSAVADGRMYSATAAVEERPSGDSVVTLWHPPGPVDSDLEGRYRYRLSLPALQVGASGSMNASGVCAPMPGRVVKVLAGEGELVTKGQVLVLLEAMKMEHGVAADRDGVVEKLLFAAGDLVDDGAVLVSLAKVESSE